ncbi:hypothetical protein JP0493_13950 [Helicobacter pylori]
MNDKRFRKYCSFSIFLSLLGMFELEAKEEEKEERKTERKKDKKRTPNTLWAKLPLKRLKFLITTTRQPFQVKN